MMILDETLREGVAGYWHYHLAVDGKPLCGNKDTMTSGSRLDTWGFRGHLKETYCKECEKVAIENGFRSLEKSSELPTEGER